MPRLIGPHKQAFGFYSPNIYRSSLQEDSREEWGREAAGGTEGARNKDEILMTAQKGEILKGTDCGWKGRIAVGNSHDGLRG